jgi:hypothetical protein
VAQQALEEECVVLARFADMDSKNAGDGADKVTAPVIGEAYPGNRAGACVWGAR